MELLYRFFSAYLCMCEGSGNDDRSAARSDLSGGPARRGMERTKQVFFGNGSIKGIFYVDFLLYG